ncbi:MAG: MoxR family ATPase [Myxococcota bacterium]|nr:MoxR family ATPase [Myxococcota bacterium]
MSQPDNSRLEAACADLRRLEAAIRTVFIGQHGLLQDVLTALLAGGNVLLEGSPGLGKTLLVRVLSQALALDARRIQFTPDLMPADITGGTTLIRDEQGGTKLAFRPGPVFANIVLADEINRGTPKTQSALLEAMQERAVTVGGERRILDAPFHVIATQNPIEHEGTYPLPEAQLDRFLLKLLVPFPDRDELVRIGLETTRGAVPAVEPVIDRSGVLRLQALCRDIVVGSDVAAQAADLVLATHPGREESPSDVRRFVRYGASPRAMQALLQAGRARALLEGRAWVSPDDLRAVALPVLRHRVHLGLEAELEGIASESIVGLVLDGVLPG